ncbi:MAG: hypothetical protein ACRCTA_03230, partial [Bacilli bacterium]
MKIKFTEQQYQLDAINSICDIFDGSQVKNSLFTIELKAKGYVKSNIEELDYIVGHSNRIGIPKEKIFTNVRKIQSN